MKDPTEFLLARIDEDEGVARACPTGYGDFTIEGASAESLGEYLVRNDPARVLAECEAKRRIVDRAFIVQAFSTEVVYVDEKNPPRAARRTKRALYPNALAILKALATVYAEHPDYDEEWKP